MNFMNLVPIQSSIALDEGCGGSCMGGCKACEGCLGCKDSARVVTPDPEPDSY